MLLVLNTGKQSHGGVSRVQTAVPVAMDNELSLVRAG